MLAAPNAMGHMGNEAFVLAVTRYFGQPSYISRSMEGLYFGKSRTENKSTHTATTCAAQICHEVASEYSTAR